MKPDLEHFEEYDAATADYSFGFEILIDRKTNEFVAVLVAIVLPYLDLVITTL